MKFSSTTKFKYIIGIDEAGRGPLAGPVSVAGIRIRIPATKVFNFQFSIFKQKKKKLILRDSKKLSARQREEWFKILNL